MKILSYGEIIWDVYPDRRALGGAPLNFAIHCAARGAVSFMISAIGNDKLGAEALKATEEKGVKTDLIVKNGYPTGRCDVTLDENKVPSYSLMRDTAYDFIELSENELSLISSAGFDAVCFGTLIQRSQKSRTTLKKLIESVRFPTVFCDVNLRKGNYDASSSLFCLDNATDLKISLEEAPSLTELGLYPCPSTDSPEDLANSIFSSFNNVRHILLTDGERGAYSIERGRSPLFCPAKQVKVVSTVGAGDSFGAAWLTSHFSGDSAENALKNAVNYSADVISGRV